MTVVRYRMDLGGAPTLATVSLLLVACGQSTSSASGDDGGNATGTGGTSVSSTGGSGGSSQVDSGSGGTSPGGGSGGTGLSGGSGGTSISGGSGGTSASGGSGGTNPSGGSGGTSPSGGSGGTSPSGGSGGTGGAPHPGRPLAEAACATFRGCCNEAGFSANALGNCEDDYLAQNEAMVLVSEGRATIDSERMAECITAYEAAADACTRPSVDAACRGVFVGTLEEGEPCINAIECRQSDTPVVCVRPATGGVDPDPGVCRKAPRGTNGDNCAASCPGGGECLLTIVTPEDDPPLAFCYEEDGLYCPLGGSCSPLLDEGSECTEHAACGSDGFCLGTCEPRSAEGVECQFNYGCYPGFECDSGTCAESSLVGEALCAGDLN